MNLAEKLALKALHCLDPEQAHGLALKGLRLGLAPKPGQVTSQRLASRLFGLDFPNPVGTAAGFDKNAVAPDKTLAAGFGFAEVGAVTPRAQTGNPKPRLFRLNEDSAVINRFGFNNEGMETVGQNLRRPTRGIVGVNLGANKDSDDKAADYATVLTHLYTQADFFTVNVSSPNTEKLRDLQGKAALSALLDRVIEARAACDPEGRKPILLKIAPDLTEAEIADIAAVSLDAGLSGIVATNTTLDRTGLRSRHAGEAGGLSGAPLKDRALQVLRRLRRETGGQIPLIGVGGIASAEDAYARIRAGASLVQLYSALVFEGIGLGAGIAQGLDEMMARDGITSLADAIRSE